MATGKHSWFICDRSGFRFKYRDRVQEPGTGFIVGRAESDGAYGIVNSPLNKSPDTKDNPALLQPRPEVVLATTGDSSWTPCMTTAQGPPCS